MYKKKKILFIINTLGVGGTEKVLIDLLKNFDYTRFDVEVLLSIKTGVFLDELPSKVKVISVYSNSDSFRKKLDIYFLLRFRCSLGFKQSIRSKISKHYDTIISFCEGQSLMYHSYIIDRADKNISWVHTDLLNNHYSIGRLFTKELEERAYIAMDEIIFVSNAAKKQFEKLYPSNIIKKTVILNPIDYDCISSYRREYNADYKDRCFNIVSVGGLRLEKAYDRLIRLAKRLKETNCDFYITIIGEGVERNKLEGLIAEYGLQNYVSLPGFFTPPYSKMAEADLFISTSFAEGFSLVLCEAFCLGLPVVSTKTIGPMDLIDNDKYGILVDHNDESIYKGVKRILDNKELRLHYHKKSLERAKIFNIKATMKQVFDVL